MNTQELEGIADKAVRDMETKRSVYLDLAKKEANTRKMIMTAIERRFEEERLPYKRLMKNSKVRYMLGVDAERKVA